MDITAANDVLGLCDPKDSYKYMSDFGRLRSYSPLEIIIILYYIIIL